jgi:hypothetical protein
MGKGGKWEVVAPRDIDERHNVRSKYVETVMLTIASCWQLEVVD